ncbi:Bud site selection protein 6 [Malassezia brasiliensis]|uniref:Bud site selection protein 6 n=1 Tax=Malassezia brasiliensis TaxID=1821822 RepID=A0AAF0IR87_9BASI|nr:Bud site selection protein 6 [Malassezia brasiliensis]
MDPVRAGYGGTSAAPAHTTQRPVRDAQAGDARSGPRIASPQSSERRGTPSVSSPSSTVNHMESSVTRLLVATKMLLESLTSWSLGTQTESQVSEIYVRLGNDFNAALAAFAGYGIDMSDMYSVPADLRVCLETCLSEHASPATLEQYLPRIREIIIRLLQGLKVKQASYKQLLLEQRTQAAAARRGAGPRTPSSAPTTAAPASVPSAPRTAPPAAEAEEPRGTPRRAEATGAHATPPDVAAAPEDAPAAAHEPAAPPRDAVSPPAPAVPARAEPASPPHGSRPIAASLPFLGKRAVPESVPEMRAEPSLAASTPAAPAPRGDDAPSAAEAADDANLHYLRNRDTLERRASKRFSAYNYNKMGVSSGLLQGAGTQLGASPRSSVESRMSYARHTPHGSLANTSEVHEVTALSTDDAGDESMMSAVSAAGDAAAGTAPRVPGSRLAPIEASPQEPHAATWSSSRAPTPPAKDAEAPAPAPAPVRTALDVFVQLGRQTRKVSVAIDPAEPARGLTVARLRMLFVDQFAYSPGMDNFPPIYIQDPQSGVAYQLEDLDDVQDRSVLTLNIEPLDQVKQHVDLSMTSVVRELRELKQLLRDVHGAQEAARASAKAAPIADAAFRAAGHRMSAYVGTPVLAQGATGSEASEADGARVARELKAHYEALQKLRSDFAILRQVHGDSEQEMRVVFAQVREQVREMEHITALGPSAGRNLIESGKGKLDARSQEVLTTVEDLQDLVEDLKLDVSQRGVKPKPAELRRIAGEIASTTQRLDELEQFVHNVKPGWKKTWEAELQNIVDEQEFLNYQEGLLADLQQDHKALQEVFANIQQVVKLRTLGASGSAESGAPRAPRFVPPPPDEEHEGIGTVMIEVRGQSIDHERRLRALQAAERSREKARAGHKDEFASELAGFVDGNALRKTGGHREVDRIRQKRDQNTLRSMLLGTPQQADAPGAGAPGAADAPGAPPPAT